MYKRVEARTEFFYLRNSPPDHTITEEKVLYAFVDTNHGAYKDVVFFDKYNLEWDLKFAHEVMNLTFQGMPIVRIGNDMPRTSNFVYRNPGPIYTPVMNTSSFTSFRPIPSTQRVSFAEPGPRPMGLGVMYESSGHPATGVPIRPPPTSSLHTPLTTTGFRPSGGTGAPMRGKTRPSHF